MKARTIVFGASLFALSTALSAARANDDAGAAVAADSATHGDTIIVTGTRRSGLKTADSPAPIQVLNAEALSHVGQPNLNQALAQVAPSFRSLFAVDSEGSRPPIPK